MLKYNQQWDVVMKAILILIVSSIVRSGQYKSKVKKAILLKRKNLLQ